MRDLVVLLLIGILAACPILCGTDRHGHGLDGGTHETAPRPVNDDCCSCNGAIQATDAGQFAAALALAVLAIGLALAGLEMYLPRLGRVLPPAWEASRIRGRASPAPGLALLESYRC